MPKNSSTRAKSGGGPDRTNSMSWTTARLGDVVSFRRDPIDPVSQPNLRYVGLEHLDSGQLDLMRWGTAAEVTSLKNRFYANDILYGKLRTYLDKAALAPFDGICSTDIIVLSPSESVVQEFVAQILHTEEFKAFASSTTTGVNHPRTSWNAIREFQFPLPPLREQREISRVLSTIRRAQQATREVVQAARSARVAALKHLLTYGPVFVAATARIQLRETESSRAPAGWAVRRLKDIATLQRGKDLPKQDQIPGRYPIVGSSGVLGYHKEAFVRGPGIVTGRSGSIGSITYVEGDFWAHNTGLYVKDFHGNSPKFVYYLMHLLDFKKFASGTGVPTLNRNFIHDALLAVPPGPEQEKIATILSVIDAKIKTEEVRADSLGGLYQTLLQGLLTGNIRLPLKDVEVHA